MVGFQGLAATSLTGAGWSDDAAWLNAKRDFDARIAPFEEQLRSQLRNLLEGLYLPPLEHGGGGMEEGMLPQEVIREVSGLRHILSREAILSDLTEEVGALLGALGAYLRGVVHGEMMNACAAHANVAGGAVLTLHAIAQGTQRAMQVVPILDSLGGTVRAHTGARAHTVTTPDPAWVTLGDMLTDVHRAVDTVQRDGKMKHEETLAKWIAATESWIHKLRTRGFGDLMSYDKSGNLRTAFSKEIVLMLKEGRQLASLGLKLPASLMEGLTELRNVAEAGMQLMQLTNFYNEVASSIADCHKRMLTEKAQALEAVIEAPVDLDGRPLALGSTVAIEQYIRRLGAQKREFETAHDAIVATHRRMEEKFSALLDMDLVGNRGAFARRIEEMAKLFPASSEKDASGAAAKIPDAQRDWRLHWDMQIKKALTPLFRHALATYHARTPPLEMRAMYVSGRVVFEPSLEEARQRHFKNLASFIAMPHTLTGLSKFSAPAKKPTRFFASVAEGPEVAKLIAEAYKKGEDMFNNLASEVALLSDWLAMGAVADLEAFVDQHCDEVATVKPNLTVVAGVMRQLTHEVHGIPTFLDFGCVHLHLDGLRESVSRHAKLLQDAINSSQLRHAKREKEEIDTLLESITDLLKMNASSVSEIGEMSGRSLELIRDSKRGNQLLIRVKERNRLIAEISRSSGRQMTLVDITELEQAWTDAMEKLTQFDSHLEDQRKQLEQQVEKEKAAYEERIAIFATRWAAAKQANEAGSGMDPNGGNAAARWVEQLRNRLADTETEIELLVSEASEPNENCRAFGVAPVDISLLEDVRAEVAEQRRACDGYEEFIQEREALSKAPWISIRERAAADVDDFVRGWKKRVQIMVAPVGSGSSTSERSSSAATSAMVGRTVAGELEKYERIVPHLKYIQGNSWEAEHWSQLFRLLGMERMDFTQVTLLHFLERAERLAEKADDIRAMDAKAQAEAGLRKAMNELKDWGIHRSFALVKHNVTAVEGKTVQLIREWKDLMTEAGDMQALVVSLKQSPFFANSGIKDEANTWDGRLGVLSTALGLLNDIQRRWVYLEPIFARGALPSEQGRFGKVDREFQGLLGRVARDPNVKAFADMPSIDTQLTSMLAQLEHCQKALLDFLEERRSVFPRFYFIGDDDLLEILSQSKNPNVIQSHLKKLFAGIYRVQLAGGKISHMYSSESETVSLLAPVITTDQVESWLMEVEKAMRAALQAALRSTTEGGPNGAEVKPALVEIDFAESPAQILCLSEQIRFTCQAENAIASGNLKALQDQVRSNLAQYTAADYRGKRVMELKIKALVLDAIHHLDVIDQLVEAETTSTSDWAWNKQLRFYLVPREGACRVRMASSSLAYSFEYQGNAPKLVYTPLTDKCFLTLTQAIKLGYGGNPYGPAGTGKTESVKALGQYLARQVLVFNCDEEFDFKSMGRIFMGLLKCGAWGCFDEFNRLEPAVLSAVSQQIQQIQSALKARAPQMMFMGKAVSVDSNAGIFVTLNPAGKGYGGRSQLPDNLKQLFRSVAMTVPDNELIAEVMLLAEGFRHAKVLATKVVSLFDVSRQLLSRQQHYDWGLRALKTILGIAGKLLRDARGEKEKNAGAEVTLTNDEETTLVVQAVLVTKIPSLTSADHNRFHGLLKVQFPGTTPPNLADKALIPAIEAAMASRSLAPQESQVQKVLQLHLATLQRIGVIIVGPSGTGKSTLWQVLEDAQKNLGTPVKVYKMNPKAIERKQLLGNLDLDTREWTDGVLTAAARKVVAEDQSVRSWIVCDGDVDPEWIESLNSVLDDNRLLTLPNGERLQLGSNVNFIFECHSLSFASPATISRCGMIYISQDALDVRRDMAKWLADLAHTEPPMDPDHLSKLSQWCSTLLPKAYDLVSGYPPLVNTTPMGTLRNCLVHIRHATTEADFLRGLALGLGANLRVEHRTSFLQGLTRLSSTSPSPLPVADVPDAMARPGRGGGGGNDGLEDDDVWDNLGSKRGLSSTQEVDGLVPTSTALLQAAMVGPWLAAGEPVVLSGPSAAGKYTLAKELAQYLPGGGARVAVVACSATTGAAAIITKIKQICGKPKVRGTGKVLFPSTAGAGGVVLLVKDADLPRPDKYGTVQLIAFLHQLVTYQGFYDEAEGLDFVHVEGLRIVLTIATPGTMGRCELASRLTANTRVAVLASPGPDELEDIAATQLEPVVLALKARGGRPPAATSLAKCFVAVHAEAERNFSANDHRHYQWSPRLLTQWARGLAAYDTSAAPLAEVVFAEGCRLYADRLVTDAEVTSMESVVAQAVQAHLQVSPSRGSKQPLFSALGESLVGYNGSNQPGPLDVLKPISLDDYASLVSDHHRSFTREIMESDLVFFPLWLRRMAQVERALAQPGGSVLLVGRAASGRRSVARLAAFQLRMQVVAPALTRGYALKNFRTELKDALEAAGTRGQPTLFLVDEHSLPHDAMIEDLNAWILSGEIIGLLGKEDIDRLLGPLERDPLPASAGGSLEAYFLSRARENLRIAICLDPSSRSFRERGEVNPALFGTCSMIWMDGWGADGEEQVALHVVEQETGTSGAENLVQTMSNTLVRGAAEAREAAMTILSVCRMVSSSSPSRLGADGAGASPPPVGATDLDLEMADPRKLTAVLTVYARVRDAQRTAIVAQQKHLRAGVDKLEEASETVDVLRNDAHRQRQELSVAQAEAEKALERITQTMSDANTRKREVERLSQQLVIDQRTIATQKASVEEELRDVQPMIEQARAAVGGIKKQDLAEIKSMKAPPDAIRDVLEAVMRLTGVRDTSWSSMRNFLGNVGFKDAIINFDAHAVDAGMYRDVSALIQRAPQSFDPAGIARVSKAAAPLAAWTRANLMYSQVLKKVAPLESQLVGLTQAAEKALVDKENAEREIAHLESSIGSLKENYSAKMSQAESLKLGLKKVEDTLERAEGLLGALVGERDRWRQTVDSLAEDLASLSGAAVLAACFMVLLPQAPEDVRAQKLLEWSGLAGYASGHAYSLTRFLVGEQQRLQWRGEGLPGDELSIENALSILHAAQSPFIVDPSSKALDWLVAHLQAKGLPVKVVGMHEKSLVNALELAVRFGETLIVRDLDDVDPILIPLLEKRLLKQGPRTVVPVGDKMIDHCATFQLFCTTRNPHPQLLPEVAQLVTVVNFSVTRAGLQAQLMGATLQHEKPELEVQLQKLLRDEEMMKTQLSDLERSLLDNLASSSGNILENTSLLTMLNETKNKAQVVQQALLESVATQERLDAEKATYSPVTVIGTVVYFAIQDLRVVNHVYAISLPAFMTIFSRVLAEDTTDPSLREVRVASLQVQILARVYAFVARGLFNQDRLTFALHMSRMLVRHLDTDLKHHTSMSTSGLRLTMEPTGSMDREWDVLLRRVPHTPQSATITPPAWLPSPAADTYRLLVAALPDLSAKYRLPDATCWTDWATHATPESAFPSVPGVDWTTPSAALHKLLLVQALRPDRTTTAIRTYACSVLRIASTEPPPVALDTLVAQEATAREPVLFLVTPGADPSGELHDLASKAGQGHSLQEIAMGQGQAEEALRLLHQCAQEGTWLCLKNLHLVVHWLPQLEKQVFALTEAHPNFRLFFTSEPHQLFPTSLLEYCIKVTFEAPPGLKNNLLRSLSSWGADYFASPPVLSTRGGQDGNPPEAPSPQALALRGRLLFALAWFHALVQERRTYVPLGWSKFHEFSNADLRSGADIVDLMGPLGGARGVAWPYLHGLLETAVYGGKIDNTADSKILSEYVHVLFSDATVGASFQSSLAPLPGTRRLVIPSSGNFQDLLALAKDLPSVDPTEVFSLPANVERTAQEQAADRVVAQLRALDVSRDSSAAFDIEKWRKKLSVHVQTWKTVKQTHPGLSTLLRGDATATNSTTNSTSPVVSALALETANATTLLQRLDTALTGLDAVLHHGRILTADIEKVGQQLMRDRVPDAWDDLWEGPEDPLRYVTRAGEQATAVSNWHAQAVSGTLLDGADLDLRALFRPAAFLNAIRLEAANARGISMDGLRLVSSWDGVGVAGVPACVKVCGLAMSGATFDGRALREVSVSTPAATPVPAMHLAWVPLMDPHPTPGMVMDLPVYLDAQRAATVCQVQVPVPDAAAKRHWTLAGVALFVM